MKSRTICPDRPERVSAGRAADKHPPYKGVSAACPVRWMERKAVRPGRVGAHWRGRIASATATLKQKRRFFWLASACLSAFHYPRSVEFAHQFV